MEKTVWLESTESQIDVGYGDDDDCGITPLDPGMDERLEDVAEG